MADAEQIITASLRLLEVPNPELATRRILADLAGHHWQLKRDQTKVIEYCDVHTSVKKPCQLPHDPTGD